ncbi:hypothetical protein L2E82_51895 [Cichorium intybus]|nr:hypothetical protein L2E82_51895 [Cichorium intybus]
MYKSKISLNFFYASSKFVNRSIQDLYLNENEDLQCYRHVPQNEAGGGVKGAGLGKREGDSVAKGTAIAEASN